MRVAHVSDVHLLSLEGARWFQYLNKRWMGGLNLALNRGKHYTTETFDAFVDDVNAAGVDHVVCTGDVTNLAFRSEFEFARARFARLALPPAEVTCIPGNHDTYVAEARGLFEEIFAAHCTSDAAFASDRTGPELWPIVRVRGDLAIVGTSTSRAVPWFFAHGELGREQLERVEAALADPRLADKFRMLLVHHPPAGPYTRKWQRNLRDHQALGAVLARTGADLVLHGHEHLDLRADLVGPGGRPIPVVGVCSGSYDPGAVDPSWTAKKKAHAEAHRARYRIYDIARAADGRGFTLRQELRAWQPATRRFAAEAEAAPAAA